MSEPTSPTTKDYIIQSLLATLILFVILYILDLAARPIIVTAVASTAFIIFVTPHGPMAQPRNVIGGHALGVLAGVCSLLLRPVLPPLPAFYQELFRITMHAAAVGVAITAMLVTNTRHPPAAGTALAVARNPLNWRIVLFILASVTLLSLARWLLRSKLRNLN